MLVLLVVFTIIVNADITADKVNGIPNYVSLKKIIFIYFLEFHY